MTEKPPTFFIIGITLLMIIAIFSSYEIGYNKPHNNLASKETNPSGESYSDYLNKKSNSDQYILTTVRNDCVVIITNGTVPTLHPDEEYHIISSRILNPDTDQITGYPDTLNYWIACNLKYVSPP